MRLAVCSSKGGVGKTSTAANLAAVLGTRGRTLAVDADPQDSLGRAFGVVAKGREDSLAGLLEDPARDPRAVLRSDVAPGLDLSPRTRPWSPSGSRWPGRAGSRRASAGRCGRCSRTTTTSCSTRTATSAT